MNDLWTKLWPALEPFAPLISSVIVAAAAVGVRFALVAINRLVVHRIVKRYLEGVRSYDDVRAELAVLTADLDRAARGAASRRAGAPRPPP
jgi:hypothetical protein